MATAALVSAAVRAEGGDTRRGVNGGLCMQLGEVTRHIATSLVSIDGRHRSRGAGDARRGTSPLGGKGAGAEQRRRLSVCLVRAALQGSRLSVADVPPWPAPKLIAVRQSADVPVRRRVA